MKLLVDLFKGPDNQYWDLGRVVAFLAPTSLVASAIWNVMLGLPIDLGPTGFAGGLAAVVTACAALIYAKDRARAENTVAGAINTTADTGNKVAVTDAKREAKEK